MGTPLRSRLLRALEDETAVNSAATGKPTIAGTAQVGKTLTANTAGIADADGLENAIFSYQWLADDAEIAGATNATYTLVDADEGKVMKVRVTFTDDADNEETLTSGATDAVAGAQPTAPPDKPTGLEATATHDSVTLTWDDPDDDTITGYLILRRIPGVDTQGHFDELVANTGTAATTYTDDTVSANTRYTYRIKAINEYQVSDRSRWYHINTPAAPVPDKPTGLEATATHDSVTPHLGRPRRRHHHRLRHTAPRAGEQYRGRFQCIGRGHEHGRHHLHRQHGGGRHHLHLPHQGHQPVRGQRAVPLVPHRHPAYTLNTGDILCGVVTVAGIEHNHATVAYGFLTTPTSPQATLTGEPGDETFSVGTNGYTIVCTLSDLPAAPTEYWHYYLDDDPSTTDKASWISTSTASSTRSRSSTPGLTSKRLP